MSTVLRSFTQLSNAELLSEVRALAQGERHATVQLIASLIELDVRRLYLGEGYSSLFTYCTRVLRLSEHAAYGRIEAARAARRFPVILNLLADGAMTLTTVGLLARHLTPDNHGAVLESARHKSKREVERLVVELSPRPTAATVVRRLPAPSHVAVSRGVVVATEPAVTVSVLPAPRTAVVSPLAPERYKVQLTITRETHDKLRRVQDLMRHALPNGDVAEIFDRALTVLLEQLIRRKLAATDRPRAARQTTEGSRHIPAAVKRAVWSRDAGRCAFVGTRGRCSETGLLEFHHVTPFAAGGQTREDNLELRCRAHNAYEAEQYFGAAHPSLLREWRGDYVASSPTRSGPSIKQPEPPTVRVCRAMAGRPGRVSAR
jgi:5-methylcytosine-specific restriction endonuclease McrA